MTAAILTDHAGPRRKSSSIQDVARRLLTALQAEGYGNNVAVAGNSTDEGVVRERLSRLSTSKSASSSGVTELHNAWT